jgi:hypothetical protein
LIMNNNIEVYAENPSLSAILKYNLLFCMLFIFI